MSDPLTPPAACPVCGAAPDPAYDQHRPGWQFFLCGGAWSVRADQGDDAGMFHRCPSAQKAALGLRQRVAELEAGLRPLAGVAKFLATTGPGSADGIAIYSRLDETTDKRAVITVGDCRTAKALLEGTDERK